MNQGIVIVGNYNWRNYYVVIDVNSIGKEECQTYSRDI